MKLCNQASRICHRFPGTPSSTSHLNCAEVSFSDHLSPIPQVKDGQVCLGYDLGHGNISGCIPFSINDGNWYKVGASSSPAVNLGEQLTAVSLFPYLQFSY